MRTIIAIEQINSCTCVVRTRTGNVIPDKLNEIVKLASFIVTLHILPEHLLFHYGIWFDACRFCHRVVVVIAIMYGSAAKHSYTTVAAAFVSP